MEELSWLLMSATFFWPAHWGVIVALDSDSELDAAACKQLPKWVRCIIIERPPFYDQLNMTFRMLGGQNPGMVWKEWSECWADRYSSADYIAVIDTDVVFVTFGIEQLLFARGASNSVRPIIWGHA
ncbi:unnamed protein product, partial [Polarella glacialis]